MNSTEFCHWLNGMFELTEPISLNTKQTELIKKNLESVFSPDEKPMAFCSFLKGYLTISNPEQIGEEETQLIRDYLQNALGHTNVVKKTTEHTEGLAQQKNPRLQSFC